MDSAWTRSDFRHAPLRSAGDGFPESAHHLGRGPKHYRRSKTGQMLSDYSEFDFRPEDNSGVRANEVPAGTRDIGVFHCVECGATFEAIIANRVRTLRDGDPANRCARCTGWTPKPGNSLADLPGWLRSQLRVPGGVDLAAIPLKGGMDRRFLWECPAGHQFFERVANRLRAHAKCQTNATHSCGCAACSGLRASDENNFATTHPELAARLDRMALRNGYTAAEVAPQGGKRKHWFWCGKETHPPYFTLAHNARNARGLGCHGCSVEKSAAVDPHR